MKRTFDFLLALAVAGVLALPTLFIALAVLSTSPGPVLYWSDRVGRGNRIFRMPKFRSMRVDTPAVATHLLQDPKAYLTPIGSFLRKSSLDEIPQLWSILKGDMSFVGPRPALFNQVDLIELRTQSGVEQLLPGLTGWAQVQYEYGRTVDDARIKLEYDLYYVRHASLWLDLQIIFRTIAIALNMTGA